MEIFYIIGILAAFLLGAYVREPFLFVKKTDAKAAIPPPPAPPEPQSADDARTEAEKIEYLNNLFSYNHDIARRGKHNGD